MKKWQAADIHKRLRYMSIKQTEKFLTQLFQNSANEILKIVEEVLMEDFGFGEKRIKRLQDGINRKIYGK